MTEIDGEEGQAESRLCSVRKGDNSSVIQRERERKKKKIQTHHRFGQILFKLQAQRPTVLSVNMYFTVCTKEKLPPTIRAC